MNVKIVMEDVITVAITLMDHIIVNVTMVSPWMQIIMDAQVPLKICTYQFYDSHAVMMFIV